MALDIPPPIPYPNTGTPVTGVGSGKVTIDGQKVLTKTPAGYVPDGSKAAQHHKATVTVHGFQFAVTPEAETGGGSEVSNGATGEAGISGKPQLGAGKSLLPMAGVSGALVDDVKKGLQRLVDAVRGVPAPQAGDDRVGKAMAADAKSRSGPYITGGVGQEFTRDGKQVTGYDCSGFNISVLKKAGCNVKGRWIPHSAEGQMRLGKPVKQKDLQPGDLVFFKDKDGNIKHTGVFLGWIKNKDGSPKLDCHGQPMMRIMHASDHKQKMEVTDEKGGYDEKTRYYAGARRVRPDDDISKERPIVDAWYKVRLAENKIAEARKPLVADIESTKKALEKKLPEAKKQALQDKLAALESRLAELEKPVREAKKALHDLEGDPEY